MVFLLCAAGVAQVLNRLDGKPFDDADQRLFEVLVTIKDFEALKGADVVD